MNHRTTTTASTGSAHFQNVVIRASAGTGKTFQLTNRYVGLVSADEPVDTILATTFTRKAAGEILDRVLFRLAEAALEPKKLAQLARHTGDETLDRPRCFELLDRMIRALHRLRVSTLDSFFIQVARSFSLELGLPPGWQIVDPIFDQRLREEAIRAVLAEESTDDVLKLMHLLTKGEASRSVTQQIGSLVNNLYAHYSESPPKAWQSLPRPKRLRDEALRAALDELTDLELSQHKRLQKAREGDLENAVNGAWDRFVGKGLAAKIAGGEETYYRKAIPPEVIAAYRPLIEHAKAELVTQIANQTEATHGLLQRFDAAYTRLKLTRRALRFEDVTRKLAQREAAAAVDRVVYRLDARVEHLLLDEFQDTSPMQWRALGPFARRIAERGGRRSFFCVGDVKQAIYGWRGGVAEIFEALDEELGQLVPKSLNQSWRSSQPVIDTVNRVFENLPANAALEKHPEAASKWAARFHQHTTARTELAGYCCFQVAPLAGEGEQQITTTLVRAAEEIVAIHRRSPGCRIGVLVRRNAAVARLIYELRLRKIDASEEGGNPLTDSAAVQLLLSLLTLADHPGDTTAAFHLADSPLGGELGFTQFDDSRAAWRLAQQIRRELMDNGYGPAIRVWVDMLAPHCGRRDLNRLRQLVEMAYAYQPEATMRTDDFVGFVSHQRVEDPTSADVRVMTLHQAKGLQFDVVVLPELDLRLTGQTPQIVVGRPGPTQDPERICRYVKKELRPFLPPSFARMFDNHRRLEVEESLCVLYVALTRAVHALYIIVAPSLPNEKTIPATFSGLLRAALVEGAKAEPDAVLYEHGHPAWFTSTHGETADVGTSPAAEESIRSLSIRPLSIRLAQTPSGSGRELERRSPSSLEGGARIDLRQRLQLDTSGALDWGTAIHLCFEQILWLEDGLPGDDALRQRLETTLPGQLDARTVVERFHQTLEEPAIRAALSRTTYEKTDSPAPTSAVRVTVGMADPRWEVFPERQFAIRDGDGILRGSIDRLVVLYDGARAIGADVLDFKTDTIDAADSQAIAAKVEFYRPQLEAYRRAAAALWKLEPARISARLVLVDPGVVVSV